MQGYTYASHSRPKNTDRGYPLEPPRRGGSNVHPQSMSRAKIRKNIENFLLKFFIFYNFKNLCILHGQVFVMYGHFSKQAESEKTFHHGIERMWHITLNRVSAPRGRRSHVATSYLITSIQ